MLFRQIVDDKLSQYAYLIGCQQTKEAAIIDPERDVDRYIAEAEKEGLTITAVVETHIHADYLSGAREIAERLGSRVYVSAEGGDDWQFEWVLDGGYDHVLLHDGDSFTIGNIELKAVHTPGHTPEHMMFLITDHGGGAEESIGAITGDFVFVGDLGRPDLLESAAGLDGMQEPSARRLYQSSREFLALPDYLQIWPAHGAGSSCGKALGAIPQTTVGYERRYNAALNAVDLGERDFVRTILAGQSEPPLYFARMKRENKLGPALLGELPAPRHLESTEVTGILGRNDAVLIDTRADRSGYMAAHLRGSLYAPLDKNFPTVVGSLVEDPETEIFLIVNEDRLEEAVRSLVRIGYDHVSGFMELPEMVSLLASDGLSEFIEEIDFDRAERLRRDQGMQVVDVRFRTEFEEGHMKDAILAPHTRLPERLRELPEDRPLLVHCAGGRRSAVAAAYLSRAGREVRFIGDEFDDWKSRHPEAIEKGVLV